MNAPLETLVLGGGLAGSAAAAWLAKAGRPVTLLERERLPHHKVCGEFLSGEARGWLAKLGLNAEALGGAPIDRVRLTAGARTAQAKLPFLAAGLSRRILDEALLEHAAALGVRVERGVTARGIAADGAVATTHGDLRARRLLLATGKHELRGARRDAAGTLSDMVGFKTHLRLAPPQRAELARHIELHLFPGGYAGLQPIERDAANLCLLVQRDRLAELDNSFDALVESFGRDAPLLASRLAGSVALFDRPLAISNVPYGYLHRAAPDDPAWLWRLGDQAAVIPSFCGDGMAIALHSARLAAQSLLLGEGAAAYHARLRRDVARPVTLATEAQRRIGMAPAAQRRLVAAARILPPTLRLAATLTRVPPGALRRAGLTGP